MDLVQLTYLLCAIYAVTVYIQLFEYIPILRMIIAVVSILCFEAKIFLQMFPNLTKILQKLNHTVNWNICIFLRWMYNQPPN